MDTRASTETTIDKSPFEPRRGSVARRLVLISLAVGVFVTVIATVRLAAVTWATPTDIWAAEYAPLLGAGATVDPATQSFARWLSGSINDPALVRALGVVCFGGSVVEASTDGSDHVSESKPCLEEIDTALRAAPVNSELWFFKASMLAADGDFGDAMMTALRNSYRTAPAEGWIASERVVMGLRLFPALAPDLQEGARSDLALVLRERSLSQPLVDAYAGDSSLRAAAAAPLHALSADAMQRFVGMVREAVRDR